MIYCAGHSIISPLGEGTQANIEAVRAGRSGLRLHTGRFADVEPFCASLFMEPQMFVPLCINAIQDAARHCSVPLDGKDTLFVLSTTKGDNLDLLSPAERITAHFGNPNRPVVVSNACTSGVCAQITALRMLESGRYSHAVVIGCDLQSRFIVSGFQSFKALSPEPCRPFTDGHKGLNLGEAAAAIIYTTLPSDGWQLQAGSIHNDANHISAPSRTGDGAYLCLKDVMQNTKAEDIMLIGVHGTGTLYNDDMELAALRRAGLENVPRSVLKPFFGHTMGAAGVLETIIGALTLNNGIFIKMLSGFGGVNAAVKIKCV